MSQETFETCLRQAYRDDEEAVHFIIDIMRLGGESALQAIKDNWARIAAAAGAIKALQSIGAESAVVKFVTRIAGLAGAALVELLIAMILGLALGAILLAIEAGIGCADKWDD